MSTVPSQADTTADRPPEPHPSEYMTPERFAEWCALLELAAAERGPPPESWPLP